MITYPPTEHLIEANDLLAFICDGYTKARNGGGVNANHLEKKNDLDF
jgi:hypothetical protein